MKNNKIIIANNEKIFLQFAKDLKISDIKTNEDLIIATKEITSVDGEQENLVIIHGKDLLKLVDFIKNKYILIEKIIIANSAEIVSDCELKIGDVVIPNTFISKEGETKFIDGAVGENYDLNAFGVMLSGICSEGDLEDDIFAADIKSENIFSYLKILENENLIEKVVVIVEIGEDYKNLVSITDMTI